MATLSKNILPIPESVVVGSGSYTVPANKYGYLQGSCAAVMSLCNNQSPYVQMASAMGVVMNQWLSAGSTISTSTSAPGGSLIYPQNSALSSASTISVNSTAVLNARARVQNYASSGNSYYSSEANVGWSVSLFPIPVDNLPASLTT